MIRLLKGSHGSIEVSSSFTSMSKALDLLYIVWAVNGSLGCSLLTNSNSFEWFKICM